MDRGEARREFGLGSGTVALVVGGSQGSRAINEALLADLQAVADGTPPGSPRASWRSSGRQAPHTSKACSSGSRSWA